MDFEDKDARTVFCGNVAESATEEILYELFMQGGPVENISLPKDKDGRQRTFCFITYAHSMSVPYAVELFQGTRLFNRDLTIKIRNGGAGTAAPPIGNAYAQQRHQHHVQQNPFAHMASQPYQQQHHNPNGSMITPAPATALISGFNNMAHSGGMHMGPVKHSRELTQQPLAGATADINALFLMGSRFMQSGVSASNNKPDSKLSSRSDNRSNHRDRPYGNHRRNRSPDYRQHDNRGNSRHHDRNSGGHGNRRR